MTDPLRVHHLGVNCAVPTDEDQPYTLVVYLNRSVGQDDQERFARLWAKLGTGSGADEVQMGTRMVVFPHTSRNEFFRRYRTVLDDVLAQLDAQ